MNAGIGKCDAFEKAAGSWKLEVGRIWLREYRTVNQRHFLNMSRRIRAPEVKVKVKL